MHMCIYFHFRRRMNIACALCRCVRSKTKASTFRYVMQTTTSLADTPFLQHTTSLSRQPLPLADNPFLQLTTTSFIRQPLPLANKRLLQHTAPFFSRQPLPLADSLFPEGQYIPLADNPFIQPTTTSFCRQPY